MIAGVTFHGTTLAGPGRVFHAGAGPTRIGRTSPGTTASYRRSYPAGRPTGLVKHLPKHLRPRWRYLAVGLESWPDTDLDRHAFQRALYDAAQGLLGDAGSAELDVSVLSFRFAEGDGEAVVRARRGEVDRLRAALATVARVDGDPLGVYVRGVSGTVRACEEKYIRRPSEDSEKRNVVFAGSERRAVVRGDRVDAAVGDGHVGATALDIRDN